MTERITVFDEQGSKLVLGPNDHIATGGEGSVYARKDRVFKVYLDTAKAAKARLEEKVAVLRRLQHPGVAAPTGALRDKNGAFVGIALRRVEGEALCKLYTNTWRDANQFGVDETRHVAAAMREVVQFAHGHQALLVDGNELNWLVHDHKPVAIDVDSWQLQGFPATAIMASIQDPLLQQNAKGVLQFSEGSDWFAWAVVTFQLWTGIHPFKGTHPGFARNAMLERMKAGASVFDASVSLPAAVRPFSDIPVALRQWYRDVFEQGARTQPPARWEATVAAQTAPRLKVTQLLNAALRQERLGGAGGKVVAAFGGYVIARTPGGLILWDALRKAPADWVLESDLQAVLRREAAIVRLPATEALVRLVPNAGLQLLTKEKPSEVSTLPSRATGLWQSGQRMFALVEGVSNGLVELSVAMVGQRAVLSIDKQWPVNTLSTSFFRACFVQDCLGVPFLGVLEAAGLVQMKAPALKHLKVVQALGIDRHNVWVTAIRKADGESVRLRLTAGVNEFEVQEEEVVQGLELDGAVLGTGVGVVRLGDELRVAKGLQGKRLTPCGLSEASRLFSLGQGLGLFEDTEVSRLSLV